MTATVKRVDAMFRWSIRDGLGANGKLVARSYRTEIEGVFTRASQKWVMDQNGMLVPVAHSVPATAWVGGQAALLLERAGGNLVLRSQELDHASWSSSGVTVTPNATTAPDGSTTMDLLTAATTSSILSQVFTFTGNGEKAFSVFFKPGTAATADFSLYDSTAATARHQVRITVAGGVPTLATVAGAGTVFPVEYYFATGSWRVSATATGVIAANVNSFVLYPDRTLGTATSYFWGAQAENAASVSQYIPTTGSAGTSAADALYFPFLPVPQALSVYYRGIEVGLRAAAQADANSYHLWTVCDAAEANPKLRMNCFTNGRYQFQRTLAAGTQLTSGANSDAVQPDHGEIFEIRGVLYTVGSVLAAIQSASESAETLGGVTTTSALEAAWSGERLYLNQNGSGNQRSRTAITDIVFATGERSMAQMRALAER